MALTDSELDRCRYELCQNVLAVGAEPYIGVLAVFSQVVQPYLRSGAETTSSTSVTAVSSGSAATPVTLTLASGTGFAAHDFVLVDVGGRMERAIARTVSGASLTVDLKLAHSGTYPVQIESGIGIVRHLLWRLSLTDDQMGSSALGAAGIRKVDEVEFFEGGARFSSLSEQRHHWRKELARALGLGQLVAKCSGAGGAIAVY